MPFDPHLIPESKALMSEEVLFDKEYPVVGLLVYGVGAAIILPQETKLKSMIY